MGKVSTVLPHHIAASGGVTQIPLTVTRFSGSGSVLVSNGVPLQEGQLDPADVGTVAVDVEGAEVQAYVEALDGYHSDGSVRSLLVQFTVNTDSQDEATLRIGVTPTQSRLSKTAIAFTNEGRSSGLTVAALPSSAHLLECDLVPPQLSRNQIQAVTTYGPEFNTTWDEWEQYWWENPVSAINDNYYDRCLIHIMSWVREGSATDFQRGLAYGISWFVGYFKANNYSIPFKQIQPDSIALIYWLTGYEDAVTGLLNRANNFWNNEYYSTGPGLDDVTYTYKWGQDNYYIGEGRPYHRMFFILYYAWLIVDKTTWAPRVDEWLEKLLEGTAYEADTEDPEYGNIVHYIYVEDDTGTPGDPSGNNFMTGMVADALIYYYEHYDADSRIPPLVKTIIDFLWNHEWRPNTGEDTGDPAGQDAFNYLTATSTGEGARSFAGDLNGFYCFLFAWYGQYASDSDYTDIADTIFNNTFNASYDYDNTGPYLLGTTGKQFNEQFHSTPQFFYWRVQ